jgi:hypothetical protein
MKVEHSVIIALLLVVIILQVINMPSEYATTMSVCMPGYKRAPDGICKFDLRGGF